MVKTDTDAIVARYIVGMRATVCDPCEHYTRFYNMNGPISALSRMQLNFLANFQLRLSVFHKTRPILVGSSTDRSLNEPPELSHENLMALEQTDCCEEQVTVIRCRFGRSQLILISDNHKVLMSVSTRKINSAFWLILRKESTVMKSQRRRVVLMLGK